MSKPKQTKIYRGVEIDAELAALIRHMPAVEADPLLGAGAAAPPQARQIVVLQPRPAAAPQHARSGCWSMRWATTRKCTRASSCAWPRAAGSADRRAWR